MTFQLTTRSHYLEHSPSLRSTVLLEQLLDAKEYRTREWTLEQLTVSRQFRNYPYGSEADDMDTNSLDKILNLEMTEMCEFGN